MRYITKNYSFIIVMICLLGISNQSCSKKKDTPPEVKPKVEDKKVVAKSPLTDKIIRKTTVIKELLQDTLIQISEGVTETNFSYVGHDGKRMKIFLIEANMRNPKLSLRTMTPRNLTSFGTQDLMRMVEANNAPDKTILAAVNGDFFNGVGLPEGVVYQDGKMIKNTASEQRTFIGMYKDRTLVVGGKGKDGVQRAVDMDKIDNAIGGWYWLLEDGFKSIYSTQVVEPRTSVGYTATGLLYCMVIDGRQAAYSNGMNFEQMQLIFEALDVREGINLDGGGSTTLIVKDKSSLTWKVHNKPSDGSLRAVANGLSIVSLD